jgi:cell division protein FtsB
MYLKNLNQQRCLRRQAGMTTLGLIILVAFVGIFAFAAIRLTPVYLNYMKVASVVSGAQQEFDGTGANSGMIRSYIANRFDVEMVSEVTAKDIKVTKVDGGYEVSAVYAHKAPFIANISFVVDFDKRALVRR